LSPRRKMSLVAHRNISGDAAHHSKWTPCSHFSQGAKVALFRHLDRTQSTGRAITVTVLLLICIPDASAQVLPDDAHFT
jgi:hypothetical protein